mmetsp:Transcript_2046/g.6489  ORF Transcript_2046/g.6489 Transcript_2046/m.6489 type:complete len:212 (-) Transcript_2046:1607-2242(-)
MAEKGMSRMRQAAVPLYSPRTPSSRTMAAADLRAAAVPSGSTSPCICMRIFTISRGFVNITWAAPALPPANTSSGNSMSPVPRSKAERSASLTVSLTAFSGATPTSCGSRPRYSARTPSFAMTVRKQWMELRYRTLVEPSAATTDRWFCMRVFTRSIGYTAAAPMPPAMYPNAKCSSRSSATAFTLAPHVTGVRLAGAKPLVSACCAAGSR